MKRISRDNVHYVTNFDSVVARRSELLFGFVRTSVYFICMLSFMSSLFAPPAGTLDTTFNAAGTQPGTVTTTIDGSLLTSLSNAVAVQADGKIVVAGSLTGDGISFVSKFALARFNTNGTLDTTFNAAGPQPGTVTTTIDNNLNSLAYDVKIQSDGKIVASGGVDIANNTRCALARFNTNGTLDTTFNAAGIQPGTVSTTIDNRFMSANNNACTLALQSTGKIVITGFLDDAFALARFNTNGTLDTTTFNPGGIQPGTVTTTIDTTGAGSAFDVVIQADDKIVVSGVIYNAGPILGALARFNTNGSLDVTFNAGGALPGTLTTTIANSEVALYSARIQTDGKIVVTGECYPVGTFAALARFNTNGTLDTTFNATGVQPGTLDLSTMNNLPNAYSYWVTLQADGKILMTGGVYDVSVPTPFLVGLARFNTNGVVDATFNPTGAQPGTITTTIDALSGEYGFMSAIQPDSKIVLVANAPGLNRFALARFLAEGTIVNVCI